MTDLRAIDAATISRFEATQDLTEVLTAVAARARLCRAAGDDDARALDASSCPLATLRR